MAAPAGEDPRPERHTGGVFNQEVEDARAPRVSTRVSDVRANVVGTPLVPDGVAYVATDPGTGERTVFLPEHDEQARDVIAAELVACTLGQRHRPELQTDN